MNPITHSEILEEFKVPIFQHGPQYWECGCDKTRDWHRCRGGDACKVAGCRVGTGQRGPNIKLSFPWGQSLWCIDCGGYVIYKPDRDTIWEGPWND